MPNNQKINNAQLYKFNQTHDHSSHNLISDACSSGSSIDINCDKFAIIGFLGKTGLSVLKYLQFLHAKIALLIDADIIHNHEIDYKPDKDTQVLTNIQKIKYVEHGLDMCDVLIISPGISAIHNQAIIEARNRGKKIIGDIELFAQILSNKVVFADSFYNQNIILFNIHKQIIANLQQTKYIGITGTNGKTTCVDMLTQFANSLGIKTIYAGNIGVPILEIILNEMRVFNQYEQTDDLLNQRMDQLLSPQLLIFELSSFQLETINSLKLEIGIITNIDEDHLDRYANLNEYTNCKLKIFSLAQYKIANYDDKISRLAIAQHSHLQDNNLFYFSYHELDHYQNIYLSHNTTPNNALGYCHNNVSTNHTTRTQALKHNNILLDDTRHDNILLNAMNDRVDFLKNIAYAIKNNYFKTNNHNITINQSNQLNAWLVYKVIAILNNHVEQFLTYQFSQEMVLSAIHNLRVPNHRMEIVKVHNQVRYINDSKATNVHAVLSWLENLEQNNLWQNIQGKIHLILGGDGKGQNFDKLAHSVANKCASVAIIGKDKTIIYQSILQYKVQKLDTLEIKLCDNMQDAVDFCIKHAAPKDMVVLSPACSSLDMFSNYTERAKVFIEAISHTLKDDIA